VGSVILELPQAARQERLALAQRIGEALAALPTEGAKRPSLLAAGAFLGRLGQVTKETKYSDAGLKLVAAALAQPAPQPAGSREAAGGLCLLGMAVAAYPQDAATMKAYLIGVFGALRAMKETGGLWDDPAASALNLAALEAGRRVAAFKEFTEMKGADAKPPAVVAAIPEPELRALFPMQPKAPLPRLQRQFTTMIVDRAKKNAPISQDLLKYGVDEQGAYADGSPAAQGGFLLAYKKLDWRYGGNTWPGPKQARRAK
jgi:hypothetical protein